MRTWREPGAADGPAPAGAGPATANTAPGQPQRLACQLPSALPQSVWYVPDIVLPEMVPW